MDGDSPGRCSWTRQRLPGRIESARQEKGGGDKGRQQGGGSQRRSCGGGMKTFVPISHMISHMISHADIIA